MREIYEFDDDLLMVASDRISTYDVVMPTPIPDKGKVLNQMSVFWFGLTEDIVPNHFISEDVPEEVADGRCGCASWRCTRSSASSAATSPARAGRNTSESGAVCGIELPAGLIESDQLPEPIFTPATKAEIGDHDENVDFDRAAEIVGDRALMEELRRISIEVYKRGAEHAAERGIILADTKFEFGRHAGAEIVLGDEVLTPDSSRFWPADQLRAGRARRPPSTSSTSATGPTRAAGTTSRRRRSCRPTWSSRRGPNTSRPTSGSPASRSEPIARLAL